MTSAADKVKKLQPSKLLAQSQLQARDLDLSAIRLALSGSASLPIDEATIDGTVERTIEGASTIQLTALDRDKLIANSGRLGAGVDIKIDGLWFRLVAVAKQDDNLSLTFEDREVAILRLYKKYKTATRGKVTRAQFAKSLVAEVKEMKIPFVCPELTIKQKVSPITGTAAGPAVGVGTGGVADGSDFDGAASNYVRSSGFGAQTDVMLFNHRGSVSYKANAEQKKNLNTILSVGSSRFAPRSVLVAAVEVTVEECSAINVDHSTDGLSAGLFQQIFEPHQYAWGTKAQVMDPVWSSNRFFDGALAKYAKDPLSTPEQIGAAAQVWPDPGLWLPYRQMAERIVSQWGGAGEVKQQAAENTMDPLTWSPEELTGAANDHQFSRGVPTHKDGQQVIKKEDTWTCIGRLAEEVHWRRFMVSGSLYFMSEPWLFKSAPRMVISEQSPGVDRINYRYDVGQAGAEVTVECRFDRWDAPPGSIVMIEKTGPVNGRWLVTKMTRPLFDNQGTITLTKPRPKLPEPKLDSVDQFAIPGLDRTATDTPASGLVQGTGGVGIVTGEAPELAKQLIRAHTLGQYRDDNGRQIDQLKKVAAGQRLRNSGGELVEMDSRVLGALLALINAGMYVGTFALCEDHQHLGTLSQHAHGLAVDIDSVGDPIVGWKAVQTYSPETTELIKRAMIILADMQPWDMICNGNGREDVTVQALQFDNASPRGGHWESDHTNHIHFGVVPGGRD